MTTSYDAGEIHYGDYYTAGATRVLDKLAALGLAQPDLNLLFEGLLDRFEGRDWLLACALLSANDPSDWHAIAFPLTSPIQSHGNPVCLASDANLALSYCLEQMDRDRVFPTEIRPELNGAAIYRGDDVIAQIRRIRFKESATATRGRVEKAFKGLRSLGDQELLVARLKTLPGFANTEFDLPTETHATPDGCLLIPYPGNWAKAIRDLLGSFAIPIKLHQAQEVVAAFFGASSWHQLTANQGDLRCWLTPCCVTSSYHDLSQWQFYRTTAESVYAFGIALKEIQIPTKIMSAGILSSYMNVSITAYDKDVSHEEYCEAEPLLTCESPVVVDVDENLGYCEQSASIWERLKEGKAIPLTLGDWRQDLLRSNQRLGFDEEHTLQIGDWYFRKYEYENGRSYLYVEEIVAGVVRFKTDPFALYKADRQYDASSRLFTLFADYKNQMVATIPNVGFSERQQLDSFIFNNHFTHRHLDHGKAS